MKKNAGFTLIELLIVVILLSVVVSLSTPRFSATYKSLKTRSEAQKICDFLKYARNHAVRSRVSLEVFFPEENVMEIQGVEMSRTSRYRIDTSIDVEFDQETIKFYPNGMMSPFIILVNDENDNSYQISAAENSSSITMDKLSLD